MKNTPENYKTLQILTAALMIGIVIFSLLSLIIHYTNGSFILDERTGKNIAVFVVIINAIVFGISGFIYNQRVGKLKQSNKNSDEKLTAFRPIIITHMAVCEFGAIVSLIIFLLYGNYLILLAATMSLIEMAKKFPTNKRIIAVVEGF